jgi:branched-chain amino acid transport system ATP-binding protein
MLEISNLSVGYESVQVLYDISFRVNAGTVTVLAGPNGAGKTTTLKTIAGLLKPFSGEVRFCGQRIDGLKPYEIAQRGISFVAESKNLFPFLTVHENLEIGSYTSRKKFQQNLSLVYQIFPILRERKNQIAYTLSGGEQQMLAIARALMSSPKLLMLDEPSLGLSPKLVYKIFQVIKAIKNTGVTILLVEQNIREALRIADTVYILNNGRIIIEGKGEGLLAHEHVKKALLGV